MDGHLLGLPGAVQARIGLLIVLAAVRQVEPDHGVAAVLEVQAVAGRCWMQQHHGDLAAVPGVLHLAGAVELPGIDAGELEPVQQTVSIRLEAVGDQAVVLGALHDLERLGDLVVVDAHGRSLGDLRGPCKRFFAHACSIFLAHVERAGGKLQQLAVQDGRVVGDDGHDLAPAPQPGRLGVQQSLLRVGCVLFWQRYRRRLGPLIVLQQLRIDRGDDFDDRVAAELLVGAFLVHAQLDAVVDDMAVRQLQVGVLRRQGQMPDPLVDLQPVGLGDLVLDHLRGDLSRGEPAVQEALLVGVQGLAAVEQPDLRPEILGALGGRGAAEQDHVLDVIADELEVLEAFGGALLEGLGLVDDDVAEGPQRRVGLPRAAGGGEVFDEILEQAQADGVEARGIVEHAGVVFDALIAAELARLGQGAVLAQPRRAHVQGKVAQRDVPLLDLVGPGHARDVLRGHDQRVAGQAHLRQRGEGDQGLAAAHGQEDPGAGPVHHELAHVALEGRERVLDFALPVGHARVVQRWRVGVADVLFEIRHGGQMLRSVRRLHLRHLRHLQGRLWRVLRRVHVHDGRILSLALAATKSWVISGSWPG